MNSSQIKNNNYRTGAIKRKFGISASDKVEAGTLISKMNENKIKNNQSTLSKQDLAIRGLI